MRPFLAVLEGAKGRSFPAKVVVNRGRSDAGVDGFEARPELKFEIRRMANVALTDWV